MGICWEQNDYDRVVMNVLLLVKMILIEVMHGLENIFAYRGCLRYNNKLDGLINFINTIKFKFVHEFIIAILKYIVLLSLTTTFFCLK